jgi:alpha-L-fucosidase 2
MKLYYESEAKIWDEALPIGNGFLGGMIFGGITNERISLNEDSIWCGSRKERYNPDTLKYLPEIRKLLFEGKISQAQKLSELAIFCPNPYPAHYEPLGDLLISFNHNNNIQNYKRVLDLETAIVKISYDIDGITYKREIFTSAPDNILVIRMTANAPDSLNFKIDFDRDRSLDTLKPLGNNRMIASGKTAGENGVSFSAIYQLKCDNDNLQTIGGTIICEKADSAVLYLCARTDMRDKDYIGWCEKIIDNIIKIDYETILNRHINDYKNYFKRTSLYIGGTPEKELIPTDKRIELLREGDNDPGLYALYFAFGRYLLISSSRPGSYAANLQGIWNKDMFPIWDSKYTININTQMNYWLAENCNLSEFHEPLFDLIENMRESGRVTAEKMYGCRGFVAHHNTDIFGDTSPVDKCITSTVWHTGVAWLCLHIWEHYLYTCDVKFLERYYETIKEASLFFVDFLIEDNKGRLVTSPSISPENIYTLPNGESGVLCYAPSMDSQIIYSLFSVFVYCSSLLNKDMELAEKIIEISEKLPKIETGKHGQIKEWAEDYDENEPGHRHISHLFSLYPSDQISVTKTPELAKAARITLERRLAHGGGHTGWSRAWIINFWARLSDGDKVYENLKALLINSTLPNLFDNHPPFQIDGNFGGTAGIAEMLLQSHGEEIVILPALPAAFSSGYVTGLCSRGGFDVDIYWENSFLKKVVIYSKSGNKCNIRINKNITESGISKNIDFKTEKGKKYIYEF